MSRRFKIGLGLVSCPYPEIGCLFSISALPVIQPDISISLFRRCSHCMFDDEELNWLFLTWFQPEAKLFL